MAVRFAAQQSEKAPRSTGGECIAAGKQSTLTVFRQRAAAARCDTIPAD